MTQAITWHNRKIPLAPAAVVAQGEAARRLAQRLLARDDETLAQLSGVAGHALLVILGAGPALPWVDGALYLGHDSEAPALLAPTTLQPSVPLPLLERALRGHAPELPPPFAILPAPRQLLSLAAARPIARQTLARWLAVAPPLAGGRGVEGNP